MSLTRTAEGSRGQRRGRSQRSTKTLALTRRYGRSAGVAFASGGRGSAG